MKKAPASVNTNQKIDIKLPLSLDEAINTTKLNNTNLIIAKLDYEISEKELSIEKADYHLLHQ